jgi:hypothetical protein
MCKTTTHLSRANSKFYHGLLGHNISSCRETARDIYDDCLYRAKSVRDGFLEQLRISRDWAFKQAAESKEACIVGCSSMIAPSVLRDVGVTGCTLICSIIEGRKVAAIAASHYVLWSEVWIGYGYILTRCKAMYIAQLQYCEWADEWAHANPLYDANFPGQVWPVPDAPETLPCPSAPPHGW